MSEAPPAKRPRLDDHPIPGEVAWNLIKHWLDARDIKEHWDDPGNQEQILNCLLTHTRFIGEMYFKDCPHRVIGALVFCGANLEQVQEIHSLNTGAWKKKIAQEGIHWSFHGSPNPDVLLFLVKLYPQALSRAIDSQHPSLLSWLLVSTELPFVTDDVVLATFRVTILTPARLLSFLETAKRANCSTAVLEAIGDRIVLYKKAATIDQDPRSNVEVEFQLPENNPELMVPLSYPTEWNDSGQDFLECLISTPNSIREITWKMPAGIPAIDDDIQELSALLFRFLASPHTKIEKLVVKSKRQLNGIHFVPYDNWMVELFAKADRLPPTLKHLRFDSLHIDQWLDLSTWLQAPNLPSTVDFSQTRVEGNSAPERPLMPSTVSPGSSVETLRCAFNGEEAVLKGFLAHIGTALHLKSLFLTFSKQVNVTETVRSLLNCNNLDTLLLSRGTHLDFDALLQMLPKNFGLKLFFSAEYRSHLEELRTIDYFLKLNRFGRLQARDPTIRLEKLIGFLGDVVNQQDLDALQKTNACYGLLRDSIIGTWSISAFESLKTFPENETVRSVE